MNLGTGYLNSGRMGRLQAMDHLLGPIGGHSKNISSSSVKPKMRSPEQGRIYCGCWVSRVRMMILEQSI